MILNQGIMATLDAAAFFLLTVLQHQAPVQGNECSPPHLAWHAYPSIPQTTGTCDCSSGDSHCSPSLMLQQPLCRLPLHGEAASPSGRHGTMETTFYPSHPSLLLGEAIEEGGSGCCTCPFMHILGIGRVVRERVGHRGVRSCPCHPIVATARF